MKKITSELTTQKQSYRGISKAYDQGLFALTFELSSQHLRKYPHDFFVWMCYGMALTELHRYDEAENGVRRAISVWRGGKLELALRQMGTIFESKGELMKAESWYRRALLHDPETVQSHVYLGALAFGQGRLKKAERHFLRAIKCRNGPVEEAYYNLGGVLLSMGRFAKAAKCYRKAIDMDPHYFLAKRRLNDADMTRFFTKHRH